MNYEAIHFNAISITNTHAYYVSVTMCCYVAYDVHMYNFLNVFIY